MKKFRKEEQLVDILEEFECDRCHKIIKNESTHDLFELQETFSIEVTCGYGSKTWGDLYRAECDLCEQCIYDLISDFARVTRYA